MAAAAAMFVVDRIVAVEDRHLVPMCGLQGAQSLLVRDSGGAIHVGPSLKQAEPDRHAGPDLQLAMVEIAVAGMQQPPVLAAHRDAAVTRGVAGQGNHEDVRLPVAKRPHAPEAEPVLALLAVKTPVRPMLPLAGEARGVRTA